ncbi:MAG: three-helix bundle dimerization domain-containing protein [Gaiellaceae bacterium]
MKTPELELQVDKVFRALREDFGDAVGAQRAHAVGVSHYESLRHHATIYDFIPLLVYRYAKEELVQVKREELHNAA